MSLPPLHIAKEIIFLWNQDSTRNYISEKLDVSLCAISETIKEYRKNKFDGFKEGVGNAGLADWILYKNKPTHHGYSDRCNFGVYKNV